MLNSSKSLGFLVFLAVFAACSAHEPAAPENRETVTADDRPNVLFILVDDLGFADVGINNPDTFYQTPNIDALADDGVLFTNGYAANPVCSPSRAAIMTGKHPTRLKATEWFHSNNYPHREERFQSGETRDHLSPDETTIAEVFKGAGYQTSFIGKWHLGDLEEQWPLNQGFDSNLGGAGFGFPRGGYFSPYNNPNLEDGPEGEYLTDRLSDEAIRTIEADSAAPFFIFLSYYNIHVPLEAPADLVAKYAALAGGDDELSEGEFALEDQYFVSDQSPRRVRTVQNHPTYAAMMEKLDDNVGRIVAALKDSGQYDNTIIVFTSDNGGLATSEGHPTSSLPLRGGKGWLYEGGIRVPLVIRAPGQMAVGLEAQTPFSGWDFLPTLAALTGIDASDFGWIDGVDLAASLETDLLAEEGERPLFWHYPHYSNQGGFPGAAVRLGRYKLLQNFEDGSIQLYDLSVDIEEKNNLSGQLPEIADQLSTLLLDWYAETDAEFLQPREAAPDILPWRPRTARGQQP